ncbi:hypothetical protein [Pseudomonas fluorescens group sp. PF-69]
MTDYSELRHIDLGAFIDWVWALKTERDRLKAENDRSTEREIHQLAEIEALRKENERLKNGAIEDLRLRTEIVEQFNRLTAENEALANAYAATGEREHALRTEIAELRKDAERYRFLCDKFGETKLPCALERILAGELYIADGKSSIDSTIDAVMSKEAP